mmetsp:Transcript_12897/g.38579  ORF Transcript_12897/g.38579 Transcript_12897/m.38579 type:complete len:445 (+) Transcript_12897:2-1336(+)
MEQVLQEVRMHWSQPDFAAIAVKGQAPAAASKLNRQTYACRFMSADLPLDAAASAVRPVPQRMPGEQPAPLHGLTGRLFFVTMVRSSYNLPTPNGSECSPASFRQESEPPPSTGVGLLSQESTPVSDDMPERRKSRGNTIDAVAAIKPPRSPFDDVRLLRLVGQGSFGKVYFGLWMGSPVAVKIIESRNKEEKNKFEPAFEAVLSATMAHPNLVQTYMSSTRAKPRTAQMQEELEQSMETWLVQEWCDRGTLGSICSKPRVDPESIPEVVDICIDIAGAGSYLHSRGIIHGDLTANNVLIKTQVSRKGYVCKICDFGLARVLEGDTTDIMTTQLGTVTHMPPELFMVGQEVKLTAMADIYAAGILLWQAVKGESPFSGLSPPQVVVQIVKGKRLKLPEDTPAEIQNVFQRCTAVQPEDRPTFDELVRIFTAYLARAADPPGNIA